MTRAQLVIIGLAAGGALVGGTPAAWALGGECVPDCSNPPSRPSCSNPTVQWDDGCQGTCTLSLDMRWSPCTAPTPTCGKTPTSGIQTSNRCPGTTRQCHKDATGCNATGPSPYVPYGYAVPGNPTYGFSQVQAFTNTYETPQSSDMVGLSAKGNIIIGDYTSDEFNNYVKPKLTPNGEKSLVQPYVVDPSDATIGYDSKTRSLCGGKSPCFNGRYTDPDGGTYFDYNKLGQPIKTDGTKRKFYESSLREDKFTALIDPDDPLYAPGKTARIDAVLYTNHAIAGYVPPKEEGRNLSLNGTMVGRDDALVIDSDFTINHDMRLNMHDVSPADLPVTIARPQLRSWVECPPSGCPAP